MGQETGLTFGGCSYPAFEASLQRNENTIEGGESLPRRVTHTFSRERDRLKKMPVKQPLAKLTVLVNAGKAWVCGFLEEQRSTDDQAHPRRVNPKVATSSTNFNWGKRK